MCNTSCAVVMMTVNTANNSRHEATLMMQLPDHENVVRIIGVVTVGSPLLLVISFCEHGSLLHYLNMYRVSLASKLQLSRNIAAGMAHIAKCSFIHRDIAARNILITQEEVAQVAGTFAPPPHHPSI